MDYSEKVKHVYLSIFCDIIDIKLAPSFNGITQLNDNKYTNEFYLLI